MKSKNLAGLNGKSRRRKCHIKTVLMCSNIISVKEMNLIIDEITAIIYSELIKLKSSPNDLYSSNNLEGGKHVA